MLLGDLGQTPCARLSPVEQYSDSSVNMLDSSNHAELKKVADTLEREPSQLALEIQALNHEPSNPPEAEQHESECRITTDPVFRFLMFVSKGY